MRRSTSLAGLVLAGCLASAVAAPPALAASYKNCTELQKTYPHGVGKANARDKTSGKPVTTFKKDTAEYNRATQANGRLDADKDGIACEKK